MSNWARITTTVDVLIEENESVQSVTRDLCAGMADADTAKVRVINIQSHEVKDAAQ